MRSRIKHIRPNCDPVLIDLSISVCYSSNTSAMAMFCPIINNASLHKWFICQGFGVSLQKILRMVSVFTNKLPKIDESGACHLTAKRRGFRVLVELEGPIFLIGIAGSRGVHDKRALSCDVVKHYLK